MTPIPMWTPKKGFHVVRQPVQQIFALLISIVVGCLLSYILTECGVLTDDKDSKQYNARTDARIDTLHKTAWFIFPYPGQFGVPSFHLGALITFLVATILSVLDSIGDYNATAKVAFAPPPPLYAINRGVAVEGAMSILSGGMGCAHATVSYGENIGAIGLSKVASRSVFQVVGIFYVVLSILGKVGAFFISIPYSVIGGSQFITFGMLIGVVLSYLQSIDLNSTRNLSILGMSLLLGIMGPNYIVKSPDAIDTGNTDVDNVIKLLISNPSFIGGAFAFILDNTVPGTNKERGITAQMGELEAADHQGTDRATAEPLKQAREDAAVPKFENGPEVYRLPFLPDSFRKSILARYIPLFSTKVNQ
ncbi:solute carrier family 23 member 2-like [Aplysia californica]|uniref:Solute carrier family 23 member 2-like n=1 Tax=Aplysia californica TaxID=6500 RepID=A0ABM1VPF0_APLCA|nr:solute carrier family 23 member 2-like [Aplysia californica]